MALQTSEPSQAVITSVGGAVGGGTANSTTPVITGTADAGDVVYVYDGVRLLGSTVASANGTWSYTPTTALKAGSHGISAIAEDSQGNYGASSVPMTVQVIAVPSTPAAPTLTDDSGAAIPAGSTTSDNHPHINGTGTAGDTITVYNGSTVLGSTTVAANGTWSFTPSPNLPDGTPSFNVTESNSAGTSAHSNSTSITINTGVPATPPAPTFSNDSGTVIPAGSTTNDATPHINGKGTAGDTVTIYDGSTVIGSATVAADGTWTFKPTTPLPNGNNSITVVDTNAAGTPSAHSAPSSLVIDTSTPATPPAPTLTDDNNASIPAGSTTTDGHPHISGTGTAGDTITIYDGSTVLGSTTVASNGTWTFTPSTDVATGPHSINVTDTNAAGTTSAHSPNTAFTYANIASAPVITNIVDTVGTVSQTIPNGGVTNGAHPTVSGTGTPGDTIYIYQNGVGCGDTTVDSTGHWSLQIPGAMADGAHNMTATQFASGQSESAASNTWTITINTSTPVTPPAPTLTDDSNALIPSGSTSSDGHPHISGTGTAGDTITIYDGSTVLGSTTVASNGTWVFTPSTDLSPGAHNINVTDTNSAGTTSAHSANTSYTLSSSLTLNASVEWVSNSEGLLYVKFANVTGITSVTLADSDYSGSDPFYYQGNGVYAASCGNDDHLMTITVYSSTGSVVLYNGSNLFWAGSPGVWQSLPSVVLPISSGLSATHDTSTVADQSLTNVTDDSTAQPGVGATPDADQATTETQPIHTTVGDHQSFTGTSGHDTVDLNVDPSVYFKESTAHIQGSTAHPSEPAGTMPAANTLHLTGDHQILDLTSLTGQTSAAKISGIEVIDLGGNTNNLKLSLTDVLNLGEQNLFQNDGHQQMMVNGANGDTVDLSNAHIAGVTEGQWQAEGTAVVGGVTYNVYEHSGAHTELLVQQGVQVALHN